VTARAHGGLVHDEVAALGLRPESVLDFSVNVNPYGPCPDVLHAARGAALERYPDPTAAAARRALGAWLDVAPDRVVVANGAAELLWGVARAALGPQGTLLVAGPAFGEMRAAAERRSARVVEQRTPPGEPFDAEAFDGALRRERPRVAYVTTPSSPSGTLASLDDLAGLAAAHPATHMVVDISFLSLSDGPDDRAVHRSGRVLWVQSLTKELGVPGLRVGFAVGPPGLVTALEAERPPWSVSAPAEAVAIAATTVPVRRHVADSRRRLARDRVHLGERLAARGFRVYPSSAPYVLVDFEGRAKGALVRARLLQNHAVLVRDAASFGFPGCVRLAARPAADVERLLGALREELP
jgi:histidinol-phosphate/aromatic aminotransferase/cobyric acid decarboxylase-like protein